MINTKQEDHIRETYSEHVEAPSPSYQEDCENRHPV